tara:strand:- start:768 stop:4658 length:3891 start_codon:yes stop_codon:yes gene_type:complete
MSEVYKKFTAQDYSVTPFNAHKQYKFESQSAVDNKITWHNVSWTSESISLYTSASSIYGGDTKNVVKYNQIDHLFYKNFKKDILNRFGYNNYLKQERKLYSKAQILSIPSGLYGHEIKPGDFYLSSSNYEIIDDTHGNLIISGTNLNHYPTDVRKNVFKLEPTKAFKAYDLNTIPGYVVKLTDPQDKEAGITKRFWRRGAANPNTTPNYTTPINLSETDDSYYFNNFKYNKVNFSKNELLGSGDDVFSSVNFDSSIGSHIKSPHNDKYNFNDEDFSISFYIEPSPVGSTILNQSSSIGKSFGGGIVYNVDENFIYIISTNAVGRSSNAQNIQYSWGVLGANGNAGVGNVQTGLGGIPHMGDGQQQLVNMTNADSNAPGLLGNFMSNFSHNGYTDWYIPTLTEIHSADTNLKIFNPNLSTNPLFTNLDNSLSLDQVTGKLLTSTEASTPSINYFVNYTSGSIIGGVSNKNLPSAPNPAISTFLPVRKVAKGTQNYSYDEAKRYIICKSGTQTVSPSDLNPGTQTIKNTSKLGSSQPLDTLSQPQFPFEIYMQSQSLCFARSDGKNIITISSSLTGSSNHPEQHHILCQKSSSMMEIYIDGNKIVEASDSSLEETRNLANLYIGSKGVLSKKDANNTLSDVGFFNGSLSCINIWNNNYNTASIKNISESIDASPYVGNIFYQNGFVVLTKPTIQDVDVPSLKIKPFDFNGSDTIDQRMQNFTYTQVDPTLPLTFQNGLDIKPDGTRYYGANQNAGGAIAQNLKHKFPTHLYQFNMSTPFDLYSATSSIDNAADAEKTYAVISSSLPYLWMNPKDIKFHPSGTFLYFIGTGYSNLSGSEHPTRAELDAGYNAGTYQLGKHRVRGGIVQIPMNQFFDISSGSVINQANPSGTSSLKLEESKVYDTTYIKYNAKYDDNAYSGQNYKRWGGISPEAFTFSTDGTKFFTVHQEDRVRWDAGNWHNNEFGPTRYPGAINDGIKSSYTIIEHNLTVAFDISTIQTTGLFELNGETGTTTDSTLANAIPEKYNHAGKKLDLLDLPSPEGSPLQVKSITFNKKGTRMYLLSRMTSISQPFGFRFKQGGWGTFGDFTSGWLPGITVGNPILEQQGPRIWEYKLAVPFDITSATYKKSKALAKPGGILEQMDLRNDSTPGTVPYDDRVALQALRFSKNGRYVYIANSGTGATAGGFDNRTLSRLNLSHVFEPKEHKIQFQGSHLIYENEYQCTVDEYEFNDTLNISARKIRTQDSHELADFTTSSLFQPYVTTVGLYNEQNELLVVGKLGQPIRTSNEIDTTFVLRWDT